MRRANDKTLEGYRDVIEFIVYNGPSRINEIANGIDLSKVQVSRVMLAFRTKEINKYIIKNGIGRATKYSFNKSKNVDELLKLAHQVIIPKASAPETTPPVPPEPIDVREEQLAIARQATFKDEASIPLEDSFMKQLADAGSAHVHGHISLMGALTVAVDLIIDLKKPNGG